MSIQIINRCSFLPQSDLGTLYLVFCLWPKMDQIGEKKMAPAAVDGRNNLSICSTRSSHTLNRARLAKQAERKREERLYLRLRFNAVYTLLLHFFCCWRDFWRDFWRCSSFRFRFRDANFFITFSTEMTRFIIGRRRAFSKFLKRKLRFRWRWRGHVEKSERVTERRFEKEVKDRERGSD